MKRLSIFSLMLKGLNRVFTLITLANVLVLRVKVGEDRFRLWSKDKNPTSLIERLIFVFMMYGLIRVFLFLELISELSLLSIQDGSFWHKLVFAIIPMTDEFLGLFGDGYSLWLKLGVLYSYFILVLGLAHLISFESDYYIRYKLTNPDSRGRSIVFGWMFKNRTRTRFFLISLVEATLLGIVAFFLWYYDLLFYSLFFVFGALAIILQSMYLLGKEKREKSTFEPLDPYGTLMPALRNIGYSESTERSKTTTEQKRENQSNKTDTDEGSFG